MTFTLQVVETPFAVAVIMAVPVFFPVTFPPLTVAIVLSEVVHFTDLLEPVMEGVSFIELPFPLVLSCMESIFRAILLSFTVTGQEAVFPFAVAVITAVPAETEVTFPVPSTVATELSELSHSVILEAPLTVAFSCTFFVDVPPA